MLLGSLKYLVDELTSSPNASFLFSIDKGLGELGKHPVEGERQFTGSLRTEPLTLLPLTPGTGITGIPTAHHIQPSTGLENQTLHASTC